MDEATNDRKKVSVNRKDEQLEQFRVNNVGKKLTTNESVKISNDEQTLKAGVRGPTLMEDFYFLKNRCILTMNGYRKELFKQEVSGHMGNLNCISQ